MRCTPIWFTAVAAIIFCVRGVVAVPDLRMPSLFTDHMVLQRDAEVPVWGRAAPGRRIEVTIGGVTRTAVADESGGWRVDLAPMDAGGPHALTVNDGSDRSITIRDVLVGEVWLCSGQSNMEWPLHRSDGGDAVLAGALDDRIRLFHVPRLSRDVPIADVETAWALGDDPEKLRWFSGVAYFMATRLRHELGVPIGLIQNPYGGAPAEAWVPEADLEAHPQLRSIVAETRRREAEHAAALAAWEEASAEAERGGRPAPPRPASPFGTDDGYKSSGLWNGMTAALAPYRVAGAVWYQGESNVDKPEQYATLLPTMIGVWRRAFEHDDLPFIVVQLASFLDPHPYYRGWPELREAQADVVARDPNAGLVVTLDVGDTLDIHPGDKRTVGERAAGWALRNVYGRDVADRGPVLASIAVRGKEIRLRFDTGGRGLGTRDGGPPRGFAVGNDAGWWTWVGARIEGDTVILDADWLPDPVHARYGWSADAPWANLCDDAGLPAGPFRTDVPASVTPVPRSE